MRVTVFKISFVVLALCCSAPAASAQGRSGKRDANARLIGNVSGAAVAEGCGCYFRAASADRDSERYVFFEEAGQEAPLMNIGGRDVKLRLVGSTEPPDGVRRRGERFSRWYASGAVKVRMVFVAESVCPPPYKPECVANSYSVTVTAVEGKRRQTIKAVGGCGC